MKMKVTGSQCFECKHFHEDKAFTCEAFPKGIPDVILYNEVKHKRPFKGDNGIQFEKGEPLLIKAVNEVNEIEPIDPPEEAVLLQEYPTTRLNQGQAIEISQKMRETYPEQLNELSFGEMENAVLTHNYEAHRNLAIVDDKIVGAISFHYDETSETIYIDHIGTLNSPKGTGAELVRTAVDAASRGGVGISFESTPNAEEFWVRLGFERSGEISYVFEADYKRVLQIKEALGSTGRVKEQTGE